MHIFCSVLRGICGSPSLWSWLPPVGSEQKAVSNQNPLSILPAFSMVGSWRELFKRPPSAYFVEKLASLSSDRCPNARCGSWRCTSPAMACSMQPDFREESSELCVASGPLKGGRKGEPDGLEKVEPADDAMWLVAPWCIWAISGLSAACTSVSWQASSHASEGPGFWAPSATAAVTPSDYSSPTKSGRGNSSGNSHSKRRWCC